MNLFVMFGVVTLLAVVGNGIIMYLDYCARRNNKRIGLGPILIVGFIFMGICYFLMNSQMDRQQEEFEENQKPIYLEDKYYSNGKFIEVKSKDIDNMKNENYVLYILHDEYSTRVSVKVVSDYMEKHEISFLLTTPNEFYESYLGKNEKYTSKNIVIVKKGSIKEYLDYYTEVDEDLETLEGFESWIEKYIYNTKSQ